MQALGGGADCPPATRLLPSGGPQPHRGALPLSLGAQPLHARSRGVQLTRPPRPAPAQLHTLFPPLLPCEATFPATLQGASLASSTLPQNGLWSHCRGQRKPALCRYPLGCWIEPCLKLLPPLAGGTSFPCRSTRSPAMALCLRDHAGHFLSPLDTGSSARVPALSPRSEDAAGRPVLGRCLAWTWE